jgi:glycosyltransferase involved in cell wall biosynthesis
MYPTVSVVITAYNVGWCIEDTLQTAFDQTYPHLEIIVVDDGSTDDTQARLAPYKDRITYIRHATNQGVARGAEGGPARNTGVRAATGEYIAILDGDDVWAPDKIAVQVAAAQRFPKAGLIVTDGVSFEHSTGDELRSTLLLDTTDRFMSSLPDGAMVSADLYHRLLHGCMFDTPSQVMVARRVFDTVGLFSECRSEDYEFYLRASAQFEFAIIKQPLVRYRMHQSNLSGNISGALDKLFFRFLQPNIDIWKQHLTECSKEVVAVLKARIRHALIEAADRAAEVGRRGERQWARRYLWDLLRSNASSPAATYLFYQLALLTLPAPVAPALQPITRRARRLVY